MQKLQHLVDWLYVYCTDFIINLANLFNLSYYEINALFFCLIYPLTSIGLLLTYWIQKRRLRQLR